MHVDESVLGRNRLAENGCLGVVGREDPLDGRVVLVPFVLSGQELRDILQLDVIGQGLQPRVVRRGQGDDTSGHARVHRVVDRSVLLQHSVPLGVDRPRLDLSYIVSSVQLLGRFIKAPARHDLDGNDPGGLPGASDRELERNLSFVRVRRAEMRLAQRVVGVHVLVEQVQPAQRVGPDVAKEKRLVPHGLEGVEDGASPAVQPTPVSFASHAATDHARAGGTYQATFFPPTSITTYASLEPSWPLSAAVRPRKSPAAMPCATSDRQLSLRAHHIRGNAGTLAETICSSTSSTAAPPPVGAPAAATEDEDGA